MNSQYSLQEENQLVAQNCDPYTLIIGVICGSAKQFAPLLHDINKLSQNSFICSIEVQILLNGECAESLNRKISELSINSSKLSFHLMVAEQNEATIPIEKARSILQKRLGTVMDGFENSVVWILDDDMRIPKVAEVYLTWLPRFKFEGIDVLLGNFEGSSPNPPAHGIRVQLNDLIYNLRWFEELKENTHLPNRSNENGQFRKRYSDYYYDLSRKHKGHLTEPYWVEPSHGNESVHDARERVLGNLSKILTGEPFLRPLVVETPNNPIEASVPSSNRGGNTFVFNSAALKQTPNTILLSNGSENRRSDMIWAIINRYYHGFKIHAVSFPVYHHRFIGLNDEINLEKTVAEIRGSAVYAALQTFFDRNTKSNWCFNTEECQFTFRLYNEYIARRLSLYKENFIECEKLLGQIENEFTQYEDRIALFVSQTKKWINNSSLEYIDNTSNSENFESFSTFLNSIKSQIENYV